ASPVLQPPPPVQPIAAEAAATAADDPAAKGGLVAAPTTSEPTTSEPTTPSSDPPKPRGRRPPRASDPAALPERLSAAAIDRALRPARKQALRCGTENAALPGMRVRVTFSIDASGKVTDATALKPNAMLPLGRCIAKAIKAVRFPAAIGPTESVTRELVAAE
ncbi:MAG TPA: hypothetical protein VG755_21230, partial [Nannocystaceae bacterium]|nr:hypothetical protein [Nannocystaceae bacterium]